VFTSRRLGGARIEVDDTFALPTEFALEIPQRGVMLLCELRWRNGDAVGVKFLDRQTPHAPTIEEVEELRRDNARLRREIARLTARVQELIGDLRIAGMKAAAPPAGC
jgi:hypothetical protein